MIPKGQGKQRLGVRILGSMYILRDGVYVSDLLASSGILTLVYWLE